MSEVADRISKFVAYAGTLKGDEKGEAQVFCDRLFIGFGHDGYKEAGATLEYRIKKETGKGTVFPDLLWKPRVLLEMKNAARSYSSIISKRLTIGSTPFRTARATWYFAISTS